MDAQKALSISLLILTLIYSRISYTVTCPREFANVTYGEKTVTHKPTEEEFAELRRLRDKAITEMVEKTCDRLGWDKGAVFAHASHAGECYCACPDGPCQHTWDGPEFTDTDGCFVSSATCSRCGAIAMYHDMRVMP